MVNAAEYASDLFSSAVSRELHDRINHIRTMRWIDCPAGAAALERLQWMFEGPPSNRPPCCLIYGDTNCGKTTIGQWFERRVNAAVPLAPDSTAVPVVMIQAPGLPDLGSLYDALLRRLNAPFVSTARPAAKHDQVLRLLRQVGVRMIIVDEIQHVLSAKVDQRIVFLNTLKGLATELGISVVCIGTPEAVRVFQSDQQLGNRFEPLAIPRWKLDREYARFLARMYEGMELGGPADFRSAPLVTRIHNMSEGLTGETWKVMTRAAELAVRDGTETIDLALLGKLDWVAPADRRRIRILV